MMSFLDHEGTKHRAPTYTKFLTMKGAFVGAIHELPLRVPVEWVCISNKGNIPEIIGPRPQPRFFLSLAHMRKG